MIIKKEKNLALLILSLVNVTLLSVSHAYGSSILISSSLLLFSVILIFSKESKFLPIMLFYLPWSPLLKISPGSFTFFTLAIPLFFVVTILKNKKLKVNKAPLIIVLFFIAYTLLVKLINNFPVETSYVYFIFLLFFIPIYIVNFWDSISYKVCVLYMTVGILSACIASGLLIDNPQMAGFINVLTRESVGLTRLSGFYGDANFYSAQIIIAIVGILTLISKERKKSIIILQLISILSLISFGVLSVSKMFLLSTLSIISFWIISFIFQRSKVTNKFLVIAFISIIVISILYTNIFSTEIEQYIYRFTHGSLTTGRSELQEMYINHILENADKLLFGVGISNVFINGRASHSTFVQIIWQIGLVGVLLLFLWIKLTLAPMKLKVMEFSRQSLIIILLIVAYILPWFALDYLFFDEFFYYMLFVALGVKFLKNPSLE
ncbi:hypothetical protein [Priestia megaterium]|uniref:hypothetical protein n=1 Tax=Priestia megaterium TaxID=1404 RepID=UPI003C2E53AD